MQYKIKIYQNNTEETILGDSGANLLDLLQQNEYDITSPCGGEGTCGKCKVKILEGAPELTVKEKELLTPKEIDNGIRLACRIQVENNLKIELEREEEIEVLTEGVPSTLKIDPEIKKISFRLDQPTLEDQRDYLQRILDSLNSGKRDQLALSLATLRKLDSLNKEELITVTLKNNEILQLEEGDKSLNSYGIAIDIGTTTIALYLMNLVSGEELDVYSLHNPQKRFGADVISRINYTLKNAEGVEELQEVLVRGLNAGIKQLTRRNNLERDDIIQMAIVGNTIMLHTLLGISAETIAKSPYIPVFTSTLELSPAEIGLEINDEGIIKLLPSVSGYVGADIIGDMLVADFESEKWNLLIDIGTNGEIVLGNKEKLFACSAAAGPAFEGARITFGMAGVPGAISEYRFNGKGEVEHKTIGGKKARGICGSGLVDIVAELLRRGFLESTGAFTAEDNLSVEEGGYLTDYNGVKAYRVLTAEETALEEDIVLTQKDIREFQLARGAISAGIQILLKEAGIDYGQIDKVYLAGGFGNYINPHNACYIGLIPAELEEKIVRIGNGAGMGAKMYLLDRNLKDYTEKIRDRVKYIELSSRADFQTEFMNSMFFNIPEL
ncbi:MAG: hypothetical protein PWR10_2038 [Halanaerobiales bacterium]|nr:hypothetical protein [Halanaerobiales bacterium]